MSSTSNTPVRNSICVLSIAMPTANAILVTVLNLSECFDRNDRNNPSGTNSAIFPTRLFFATIHVGCPLRYVRIVLNGTKLPSVNSNTIPEGYLNTIIFSRNARYAINRMIAIILVCFISSDYMDDSSTSLLPNRNIPQNQFLVRKF